MLDCNFICPNRDHYLSSVYIKGQFIHGIAHDMLQANILAKAGLLKTLEQNVSHAEAFETAIQDQNKMSGILGRSILDINISSSKTGSKYRTDNEQCLLSYYLPE